MKKTTLITAIALVAAIGTTATLASAKDRHGPRMDLTEMDTNNDGSITKAEVSEFYAARFAQADTDGDSALTKEELLAAMADRFGDDMSERAEKRFDRMFARMDADESGTLTLEEQSKDERTARMFERLDADEDGAISSAELEDAKSKRGNGKKRGKGKDGDKPSSNG